MCFCILNAALVKLSHYILCIVNDDILPNHNFSSLMIDFLRVHHPCLLKQGTCVGAYLESSEK